MKQYFLGCIFFFGAHCALQAQSVQISIDAGLLENTLGTAPAPVGSLLQLIASPSGNFSAPTSSSYVSGDNVLIASFAMNTSGTVGETSNTLSGLQLMASTYTITSGEELTLRFYPGLTFASAPTSPPLATTFGQVRSDSVEFGPPTDPLETAWIVPAAGSSADLNYITMSDGGTYANNTAFATGIVGLGAVPEPSTSAMGWKMLGITVFWFRKKGRSVI